MAEATGMPPNTIYHALERGLENTRTETSKKIKSFLFDWDDPHQTYLTDEERELVMSFRASNEEGKRTIMSVARAMVNNGTETAY